MENETKPGNRAWRRKMLSQARTRPYDELKKKERERQYDISELRRQKVFNRIAKVQARKAERLKLQKECPDLIIKTTKMSAAQLRQIRRSEKRRLFIEKIKTLV